MFAMRLRMAISLVILTRNRIVEAKREASAGISQLGGHSS